MYILCKWGKKAFIQLMNCHSLVGRQFAPTHLPAIPQITLAILQLKKRCWAVSCWLQKKQLGSPGQSLLIMLSFVKTAFWTNNQVKIFIFKGILAFQIWAKLGPNYNMAIWSTCMNVLVYCEYFSIWFDLSIYLCKFDKRNIVHRIWLEWQQ